MRLKRLCEKKKGDKLQVDARIHEQWMSGDRDQLALALTTALKSNGFSIDKKTRDSVRVSRSKMRFYMLKVESKDTCACTYCWP